MLPVAHIRELDGQEQPLQEHLAETAVLARTFSLQDAELAGFTGYFHDIGKAQEKFQNYIHGDLTEHPYHAPVSAKAVMSLLTNRQDELPALISALAIAGHHGGLHDFEDFKARIRNSQPLPANLLKAFWLPSLPRLESLPNLKGILSSENLEGNNAKEDEVLRQFSIMLYTRMLFSCLIDADYLDTERFMSGKTLREKGSPLASLFPDIARQAEAYQSPPANTLNARRTKILNECIDAGRESKDSLFTLTVPTGGGKTFASLAFASELAKKRGFRRIIYVIPYSSVIEQTAQKFREVVGDRVLEHHYQAPWRYKEKEHEKTSDWQILASENWDAPLIVTTNNQFLESLFASRTSSCRKLHNIEGSVIIFDEAQMLPRNLLQPSLLAIQELVRYYQCAAVFCTATQPALNRFFSHQNLREIIHRPNDEYNFFRRCRYVREPDVMTADIIAKRMQSDHQTLAVFNTKRHASDVFDALPKESRFYLTTDLYPAHRKQVIDRIRDRLAKGLPCHVAATSLVEAGIDLDFESVLREVAGLDHIIQAGGRCNREWTRPIDGSIVHVFSFGDDTKMRPELALEAQLLDETWEDFPDSIDSSEAIRSYFHRLYMDISTDELHLENFMGDHDEHCLRFRSLSENFRVIKDVTFPILVYPPKDSPEYKAIQAYENALTYGKPTVFQIRFAQQYTVNVYRDRYNTLDSLGKLCRVGEISILRDPDCYDKDKGLLQNVPSGTGIFV